MYDRKGFKTAPVGSIGDRGWIYAGLRNCSFHIGSFLAKAMTREVNRIHKIMPGRVVGKSSLVRMLISNFLDLSEEERNAIWAAMRYPPTSKDLMQIKDPDETITWNIYREIEKFTYTVEGGHFDIASSLMKLESLIPAERIKVWSPDSEEILYLYWWNGKWRSSLPSDGAELKRFRLEREKIKKLFGIKSKRENLGRLPARPEDPNYEIS